MAPMPNPTNSFINPQRDSSLMDQALLFNNLFANAPPEEIATVMEALRIEREVTNRNSNRSIRVDTKDRS